MKIAVIGCGIVGAMTAYELSQVPGLQITVLDRQPPALGSTGAALGVLMGIISQKTKGRAWAMRQASLRYYADLLPQLEVPWNRQGIVRLCFPEDDLVKWRALIDLRRQQGWPLQLWSLAELQERCPQVQHPDLTAAVYSPQDYQVDPTALTLALVQAAQKRGVEFRLDTEVKGLTQTGQVNQLLLAVGDRSEILEADWVVLAAGLGTTPLLEASSDAPALPLAPVLGQAIRVELAAALGNPTFQPVITGRDVHIVPLAPPPSEVQKPQRHYWIGATVEFASGAAPLTPLTESLEIVWQDAIGFCPDLAQATRLQSWFGLRPRPQNRSAPVVEPLTGYQNVWLATGHYRNGVLLAPATAQLVRAAVQEQTT